MESAQQFLSKADMQKRWGIENRQTIRNWEVRHPDFPKEIMKVGHTPIYRLEDVEKYEKLRIKLVQIPKE